VPPEEDRATAIGNMHKNLVKIGFIFPEICSQTDTAITILHSPIGGREFNRNQKSIESVLMEDKSVWWERLVKKVLPGVKERGSSSQTFLKWPKQ